MVPRTTAYSVEEVETSIKNQNEILFENNPALYDKCIICGVVAQSRGDHYVSAISDKMPRFRGDRLIQINHPMNMVPCCKNAQCNNEKKKKNLIDTVPRYAKYYNYVLENCPCVNITKEEYEILDKEMVEFLHSWQQKVIQLSLKGSASLLTPHPGPAAPSAAEERAA
jgi:hypothetical protein